MVKNGFKSVLNNNEKKEYTD